jgi:alanine racemase
VELTGVFTHLSDADGDDPAYTRMQLERFRALSALLPGTVLRHCANSAAIHRLMPGAAFDMVRMGISLYGYPPVETDCDLRPAMRWVAPVTFVKEVQAGDAISYGRTWTAPEPRRIATVACGYGDGYHRRMSGRSQVLLHGQRAPVVGRICMDQMMVDVTASPGVKAGDLATLMGRDGTDFLSAEELAAWGETISYEVLLSGTGRVRRLWTNP